MWQRQPWEISYLYSAYSVRVLFRGSRRERTGANQSPTFASIRVIRLSLSLLLYSTWRDPLIYENRHIWKPLGLWIVPNMIAFQISFCVFLNMTFKVLPSISWSSKKTLWRSIFRGLLIHHYMWSKEVYVNMRICLPTEIEERINRYVCVRVRFFFSLVNKSLQTDELIHSYHRKVYPSNYNCSLYQDFFLGGGASLVQWLCSVQNFAKGQLLCPNSLACVVSRLEHENLKGDLGQWKWGSSQLYTVQIVCRVHASDGYCGWYTGSYWWCKASSRHTV